MIRPSYNSPVILTFSILSVIAFLISVAFGETVALKFTVDSKMVFSDPWSYIRLVSHVFGHIGLRHISGNLLLLMLLGPLLEEKYGAVNLVGMMLVTAILTGLIQMLMGDGILLGASGIVFMFITLSSFANRKSGQIPLTMIFVVFAYVGQEFKMVGNAEDNISHMAHVAGGLVGVFFGFMQKTD